MIDNFVEIIHQAIKNYCEKNQLALTLIDFTYHYFEYYDENNEEVYVVLDYLNDIDLTEEINLIFRRV